MTVPAHKPAGKPAGHAAWLAEAVVYEIYPQSFADSNADGIGDFRGVTARLDYLQWLGINTIWFNPCFASPFRDAGYDVSDYLRVAPRYGTNDDLIALIDACHERGIRVLLDLVAGHTSSDHPWFQVAANDPADDRYIWADRPGDRFVPSPGSRLGYYRKNFYDSQPALNFGYARADSSQPWRQPADAPGPLANRAALREIMAFWLDRGVAGFRVDMAFSLVKDDPGFAATVGLWQELRAWLDEAYPEAVLLPEGSEPAAEGGPAFSADFFLVIEKPHSSLFNNGSAGTLPWVPPAPCYFDPAGAGTTVTFLRAWADHVAVHGADRLVLLATADHDFSRLCCGPRTAEQLGAPFTFLLTWGSVPSIYYGDEIGMRYLPGLPDKEGSICHPTYNRAGVRTPMQWDDTTNAGFSTGAASELYLPIDPNPDRPTVAAQREDETSTLHLVRRLIALRRSIPALGPCAQTRVLSEGYPLVYTRGDRHLVVVNPRQTPAQCTMPGMRAARGLEVSGVTVADSSVSADAFGYGIFELTDPAA